MSTEKKIYGDLNLNGNEIKDFKVHNVPTADLGDLEAGQIAYDPDTDMFVMVTSEGPEDVSIGANFSKIVVESESLGDGTLQATTNNDTFTLKEGNNVAFEYDGPNKSLTVNADVDYSHQNYSEVFGDASNLTYQISHDLGTEDVVISILIEEGASVNPSFEVERYKIIDDNTIQVELNVAPGVDNLRAVVNSKHGQKGNQGNQGSQGTGAQGNQGVQGGLGNITFPGGDEDKFLFVDGGEVAVVDEFKNTASQIEISKDVEISSNVTIDGGVNDPNIQTVNFNYNGSLVGTPNVIKILKTDDSLVETDLFSVNADGEIFSNKIKDDLDGESEVTNYFLMGDKDGKVGASTYPVGSSTVFKEASGTISSAQILQSYSTPIEIVPAKAGFVIDVHNFFVVYQYNSTPYIWPDSTGFIIGGANKFIGLLDNTMLQDTASGIQKKTPVFSENSTSTYLLPDVALLFKTLNNNPYGGDGALKYYIRYSYVDIS